MDYTREFEQQEAEMASWVELVERYGSDEDWTYIQDLQDELRHNIDFGNYAGENVDAYVLDNDLILAVIASEFSWIA